MIQREWNKTVFIKIIESEMELSINSRQSKYSYLNYFTLCKRIAYFQEICVIANSFNSYWLLILVWTMVFNTFFFCMQGTKSRFSSSAIGPCKPVTCSHNRVGYAAFANIKIHIIYQITFLSSLIQGRFNMYVSM